MPKHNLIKKYMVSCDIHVEIAALPDVAGRVRPEELLTPERAAQFLDPDSRVLVPGPTDEELPTSCHKVSRKHERALRSHF